MQNFIYHKEQILEIFFHTSKAQQPKRKKLIFFFPLFSSIVLLIMDTTLFVKVFLSLAQEVHTTGKIMKFISTFLNFFLSFFKDSNQVDLKAVAWALSQTMYFIF